MRTKYRVVVSEEERARLRPLIGQGSASARLLTQARILLKAGRSEAGPGWTDEAIAGALAVGRSTVGRVRQRYVQAGLDAALRHKGPDRAYERRLDGAQEAHLIAVACSAPPAGQSRWPPRLLAEPLVVLAVVDTVSSETVRRTVQQTNSSRI